MTTSAYPAIVTKLLDVFNTAFPPATSGVYTVEGPGASDTGAKKLIFVGLENTDLGSPGNAGTGRIEWGPMSTNHARDEWVGVNCAVQAWSGDQDPASRRTDTFDLFGAVITSLTVDPSLGRVGGVLYLQDYTWTYDSIADAKGTAGVIAFTLNFRARI